MISFLKRLSEELLCNENIYRNLSSAYAANGNLKAAYLYLDSASMAKDSFAVERNQLAISGAKYRVEVQNTSAKLNKKNLNSYNKRKSEMAGLLGPF